MGDGRVERLLANAFNRDADEVVNNQTAVRCGLAEAHGVDRAHRGVVEAAFLLSELGVSIGSSGTVRERLAHRQM